MQLPKYFFKTKSKESYFFETIVYFIGCCVCVFIFFSNLISGIKTPIYLGIAVCMLFSSLVMLKGYMKAQKKEKEYSERFDRFIGKTSDKVEDFDDDLNMI